MIRIFDALTGLERRTGFCASLMLCASIALSAQTLNVLHSFQGTDAANPFAGLLRASNGNFYGTTYGGGANSGSGTVFEMTPSGTLVWVYSFCAQTNCTDGSLPVGTLIQATNGNLYGTTLGGGANNRGTVFQVTLGGTLTVLYSFCNLAGCTDGSQPYGGVIQAANGTLYGTTSFGGANSWGEVFSIGTGGGAPTTLYSFCPATGCLDGARPHAALVQATNGELYGTTYEGGANNGNGTVFKIAIGGGLTTLYSFCALTNCTDGSTPIAPLVQASNGYLYGTTEYGGTGNSNGTVFLITPSGALTTLYSFCYTGVCTDGQGPTGGLVQATDGNLYGTADSGGNGYGSIYKITPSGAFTSVYYFPGPGQGQEPYAGLIQAPNGEFYGTTFIGGAAGYGEVFSLTLQVAVPNVVGLSQAAATTSITSVGLVVGTVSTAASGTVPSGDVISESPVAGTVVNLATAVNLVISTGAVLVSVPNVVGLTQAAATTAITSAGLVVGTVTEVSSSTVLPGKVISESPVAGTSVATGSAVNLVVSASAGPILDFNGSPYQDVFIYDPVGATGYTGLSNGSGGFTYVYNGFSPGYDVIRYGTFTSNGLSDLIAYNSTSALGYVLLGSGTGTFSSAVSLFLGPGFTKVAMGDLNGDGLTDFLIYRPTDGTSYTAISNGDGTFRYQYGLVSGNFTHVLVADFNGDGKADVFYYRSTDGLAYLGISNGTGGFTFSPVSLSPGYTFVESGDISGDGKADLLFYNGTSGAAAVGLSTGSGFSFTPYQYSAGFTTVKVFDFNGDGKADVALYNMNNAIGYLGISNGTSAFTFSSLFWGPGFSTADALDLNGDGKIDVVIYNTSNAAAYTGISSGNAANPFTYLYSFWGTGRVLATAAAQP
jgi:uncharacterized repeat protein (TIGR03803 family)